MIIGQPYSQELAQEFFDAVVIGSGMGGLCAAALLSKEGRKVLVLERHYTAGGFTHTFERKGYEWDVGVHYIGDVHKERGMLRRIFDDITDYDLKWAKASDVYDRFIFNDEIYEFVAGEEEFRERMTRYFPGEEAAIGRYLRMTSEAVRSTQRFFAQRCLPLWMGWLAYPFMTRKFLSYSDRTTLDILKEITENQKLIGVLTGNFGDYGMPPGQSSFIMQALLAEHYLDGANYPEGGASNIAKTIEPVLRKREGRILVGAHVKEILVRDNQAVGVKMENGDEITAPLVVSNAGAWNTFVKLVPESVDSVIPVRNQLKGLRRSVSHLCLFAGIKESGESLGLETTNLWIYPGYDHDANMRKYKADSSSPPPSVFISFPSAKDPDWDRRHPGKSTVQVISYAPYEWFAPWEEKPWRKRGDDYEALKERFANRLLEYLYTHAPQVKGKIDYYELSTPLSTRHFCDFSLGEIYGLEHSPARFRQSWLRPRTPIKNLYLTGGDIVTTGVTGALISGTLTASAILRRNVIKDILGRTEG